MWNTIALEYKNNESLYNKNTLVPNYGLQFSNIPYHRILTKWRNLDIYFNAITLIGILIIYFSLQIGELSHKEIKWPAKVTQQVFSRIGKVILVHRKILPPEE